MGPLVPCCTVRLCPSDAALVNLTVTFTALAVSELLVNRSWPDGSAATDSVVAAEPLGPCDEAVDVEADPEAVLEALLDEDCEALELAWLLLLLLLFELPQAAMTMVLAMAAMGRIGRMFTGVLLLWFD
jgi:hypothetical protein